MKQLSISVTLASCVSVQYEGNVYQLENGMELTLCAIVSDIPPLKFLAWQLLMQTVCIIIKLLVLELKACQITLRALYIHWMCGESWLATKDL